MFIKPCNGNITSHFNMKRKHPKTGRVTPHYGTDFGSHRNNDIYASASGRVTRVDYLKDSYGRFIYLSHKINGTTYQTVYAHLASTRVNVGDSVKQGQVIGVKGTTGNSTGVHLHFEIHVGGRNGWKNVVDPIKLIGLKVNKNIAVDGYEGTETIKAEQRYWGTTVDGVISRPSQMIKRRQNWLGVKQDGYEGVITIKAEQKRYGTKVDGVKSRPSQMIMERQRRLNKGKL